MFTIEKQHLKRILRYSFFVVLILWVITSIFILYRYVWFSSNKTTSKWWTFVEWIFDSTSYLPYLRTDLQSSFYQGLLFNWCLKYSITQEGFRFQEDFCKVETKDNKTYTVYLMPGNIRSDGTPLSLDDILFTYQDIIINNKRWIKSLSAYKDISIKKESDSSLTVTFPSDSVDNKLFFTQYILPSHVLEDFDFQSYRELFSVQPIYTNCANIVSQTTDQYSLIFNLVNCSDTNLNFYQIKNYPAFKEFSNIFDEKKNSIVDVYVDKETFPGYEQHNLLTNKLVTVFFNTNSPKLRIRTRRALWWLIKHNFYTTWYDQYLIKNTDWLFDVFLSTGLNIKDYLTTNYQWDTVVKKDLIDSWIDPLPKEASITNGNKKLVYYTENTLDKYPFTVELDTTYDRVAIEYKWKLLSATSYSAKTKKATFTFGSNNFGTGLNKYTIRWWKSNKKTSIATIDIYDITPTKNNSDDISKISILYYNTPTYEAIINNLSSIFTSFDIQNHFSFERINSADELEWRLLLGDYDIIINTIDMGLKRDITKLFATDSAMKNPSQYQNSQLISLLQKYTENPSQKTLNDINNIYSKDMPFVILWKDFVPLQVKISVAQKLFNTGENKLELYDYNRRDLIYKNLKLVNTVHIDGKKVWDYNNFSLFIKNTLGFWKEEDNIVDSEDWLFLEE